MKRWFRPQGMRAQIVAPMIATLTTFLVVFSILALEVHLRITDLQAKIAANVEITRKILDVTRLRSKTKETLLLYRMTRDQEYLKTWQRLNQERDKHFAEVLDNPYFSDEGDRLMDAFASGLKESQFLQFGMIEAVKRGNPTRAERIYENYSTLHEINSARLTDLLAFLKTDLIKSEESTQIQFRRLLSTLPLFFLFGAAAVWLTVLFYRRQILRPLTSLHQAFRSVAQGEFQAPIPLKSAPLELREMVGDFNLMTTSLKETQEALRETREQALRAAQAKTDFLSNMSHEIRTPMNAIIGTADLLSEMDLDPKLRQPVDILRKSGHVLLNVVNDILDYSRLESGHITLEQAPFDLPDLLERVTDVIRPIPEEKGLEFRLSIPGTLPHTVLGDAVRIEQILLNLLGNAAKFTSLGAIGLDVDAYSDESDPRIRFRVWDTGIGIPSEKVQDIFDRFHQADSSITKNFGGTGLGLAIVKQLIDLMHGTIEITSEVGAGSAFIVSIPLPPAKLQMEPLPHFPLNNESGPRRQLQILSVDDSKDNRFLVRAFLKKTGHEITDAENGAQGLALFKEKRFDLVLMDMQMPIMDGYSAARGIREFEKQNSRPAVPIIALTAYALKEEIQKSFAAGCNLHLTKPIRKADLLRAIDAGAQSEAALLPRAVPNGPAEDRDCPRVGESHP